MIRAWQQWLLATLTISGLTGAVQAGEHVDWLDDGKVLLKLGPAYGDAVIETSRDELGSAFGPETKPFAGTTIRILTQNEGPHGAISGPLTAFAPVFEELSGAKVELGLVPVTNLYATMMLDLQRGEGRYDATIIAAYFYGELINGNFIRPIGDLMASGKFPRWSYDAMPGAVRALYTWNGEGYGILNDADGQVLYYRRDILGDPAWQARFKEALHYDLPVPPRTWQQVLDIARFFDGKNWDDGDTLPDRGMVMHLKPGEQGHYHFQSLAAAFAMTPGDKVDRYHNVFWFDPEDMKPLINSPGHVAALEMLRAFNDTGPGEQIGWRLPDAWSYFLRGKAVFMFTFGDLGALCQERAVSRVQGKCGVAPLPGSTRHWDYAARQWAETPEPQPVGNTTGGSWHGVISRLSKQPEAAYAFLSLMAIPPVSSWNAQHGWTGVNPGFSYEFLPPDGTARLEDYIKAGWDRADAEDYLRAYHATFTAPTMLPYLRIRGTPEYWSALDSGIAAAMGGRKTPAQALDDVAAAWEKITNRIGRQQQLELYRAAIGYAPAAGTSG
ncbi:extracellular solute-binding protein [Benzoatithermus flavus]|uniref:Extracellular solute-binding protein n=1 Tax=Benzoatithermus flavus TaxID=3108223 RepID=A0ABU8Y002_9PROT